MAESDLEIVRGAVFDVTFTLYDDFEQTQATDLTNKDAVLQLSERGTVYLKVATTVDSADTVSVDAVAGQVIVHLNRSHTLRLLSSCKYYLVLIDQIDGNEVEPVLEGDVTVKPLPVEL